MIDVINTDLQGFTGEAWLIKTENPLEYNGVTSQYFVVSATTAFGECETFIFPTDSEGDVKDWGEWPGSIREYSHTKSIVEFAKHFEDV